MRTTWGHFGGISFLHCNNKIKRDREKISEKEMKDVESFFFFFRSSRFQRDLKVDETRLKNSCESLKW
jgi:hypothetical protein